MIGTAIISQSRWQPSKIASSHAHPESRQTPIQNSPLHLSRIVPARRRFGPVRKCEATIVVVPVHVTNDRPTPSLGALEEARSLLDLSLCQRRLAGFKMCQTEHELLVDMQDESPSVKIL
jgi:hypothetical protein